MEKIKLLKDEVLVKNRNGEEFIFNTVTQKYQRVITKESIDRDYSDDRSFAKKIELLVDMAVEKGEYKDRSTAYEEIIKRYPTLYNEWTQRNHYRCRSD